MVAPMATNEVALRQRSTQEAKKEAAADTQVNRACETPRAAYIPIYSP